jgi:transglutaminase-like putative cysteine protease
MFINYGTEITIEVARPTPLIYMLDVHPQRRQDIVAETPFRVSPAASSTTFADDFGNQCRRLLAPAGEVTFCLEGTIVDSGTYDPIDYHALEVPVEQLPPDTLIYLLGSRYCETDRLSQVAWDMFGSTQPGWARVQAICNFVHDHLTFGYEHARSTRTALEAFEERRGVCRDFAHLMIALCRALSIPARFTTGIDYGADPALGPTDFHAYVEVFLDGRWYLFDPSGTAIPMGFIRIGTGRDAADVSYATIFGSVSSPPPLISVSALTEPGQPWELPRHRPEALSTDTTVGAG